MTRRTWVPNLILIFCVLLINVPVATYAAADEHTVAIWLFDEGSGEIVEDVSGNGHDGTFVGDVKWEQGKWGSALGFDGNVTNYVEVPHADDLNLAEWSIEVWLNIGVMPAGWHCPFAKETGAPNRNYALHLQGGTGFAHGSISVGDAFGHATFGAINICDGEWHYVAATYDGDKCTLYVDGQEDFGRSAGGADGVIGGPADTNDGPISIGANPAPGYPADGLIDEIRLSSKARTVDEITEAMEKGLKVLAAVYPSGKLATTWANIKQQ